MKAKRLGAATRVKTAMASFGIAPLTMAGCVTFVFVSAFAIGAEQSAYLASFGLHPGYIDSFIWLFSSHRGVPLLWCVAPAAFMVWLSVVGCSRKRASWVVRHRDSCQLWIEDVVDAVAGALVFGAATFASACAAAISVSGGGPSDFGEHGVFAAVIGCVPHAPLELWAVMLACAVLSFLVLVVFGAAFQLGSLVLRSSVVPFVALTLLGLPAIHGPQAFLLEVARLLSLGVDPDGLTNPLALPFSVSSVFYDSWLEGASHGFWLQGVLFTVFCVAGWFVARRVEWLRY